MSRFEHCLQVVLNNEGGLSNHPFDLGGKTNYGITQRTYDDYNRKLGLPARDVSEIHPTEVESIYYEYWKAARCDILPDGVDLMDCDGSPLQGVEDDFIKHAGIKPQAPIMRSAWEHAFMVWCKSTKVNNDRT